MPRAVLALLWWQGATCRVTQRDGRVPPSKTIKKVDCGSWNHPDSEENTRKTVYGKIGWACMETMGKKGRNNDGQNKQIDNDDGIGTGFDDDRPPGAYDDWDDDYRLRLNYETRYADPYVCWNKHLYKVYVGWNLVAAYLFSAGFLLVKAKITWPKKEPTKLWIQANLLVQTACLVEAVVSYYILASKAIRMGGRCGWFAFATMPLSKIVAFPAVQLIGVWISVEISDHQGNRKMSCLEFLCFACIAAYFVCFAACMVSLIVYSVPLYVFFFPVLLYLALYMCLAVFVPHFLLEKALSFNEGCKAKLEEYNERKKAGRLVGLREGANVEFDFYRDQSEFKPGKISRDHGDNTYDIDYEDGGRKTRVEEEYIKSLEPDPESMNTFTTKIMLPCAYMMVLFSIYVEAFYGGRYNGEREKKGWFLWESLAREVVFSVNPFDLENLRVAFAWPDRLPDIDQIFFAISISMACLDFVVQNFRRVTVDRDCVDEDGSKHFSWYEDRARNNGCTPLFIACENGHLAAARRMLESQLDNGAEVIDRANHKGMTPLINACWKGHVDAARLLLDNGADVDRADKWGQTPLFIACCNGHVDAARLVLEKGAEVNRANQKGMTPLINACWKGHVDAARLLLDNGAEVDRATEDGQTPLFIACQNGRVDAAQLLLEKGADVDRATKSGTTPLYIACWKGHVDVVRLLLDKGADVNRALENGATPLSAAKSQGNASIVALLEAHRK